MPAAGGARTDPSSLSSWRRWLPPWNRRRGRSVRERASEQIGLGVLEALRELDDVAAVRFASVYKGFEQVDDFARELGLLNKDVARDRTSSRPSRRLRSCCELGDRTDP